MKFTTSTSKHDAGMEGFDCVDQNEVKYALAVETYGLMEESEAVEGLAPFVKRDPMLLEMIGDDPSKWQGKLEETISSSMEGFWESFWNGGLLYAFIQKSMSETHEIEKRCRQYLDDKDSFKNADGETDIFAIKMPDKNEFVKLTGALNTLFNELKRAANVDISKLDVDKIASALGPCGFKVTKKTINGQYHWNWAPIAGSFVGGIAAAFIPYIGQFLQPLVMRSAARLVTGNKSMKKKGWTGSSDYDMLAKSLIDLIENLDELGDIKRTASSSKDKLEGDDLAKAKSNVAFLRQAVQVYAREVKELCYASAKVFSGLKSKISAGY